MPKKVTSQAIGEEDPIYTTLALGEEEPATTDAIGEEDPIYTTLALGEEEPEATADTTTSPFGAF
jgi:hypothetical protein